MLFFFLGYLSFGAPASIKAKVTLRFSWQLCRAAMFEGGTLL
jgi:hypothetical protein